MGKLVLKDADITINAVDLSDHIASVTLQTTGDVIDDTGMGGTAKTRQGGLSDNSLTLEIQQDFATSSVEATIYPLINTLVTVVVKPTSAAVSATNPSYTFSVLVADWSPLDAAVGALSTAKVTWQISGPITKAVA